MSVPLDADAVRALTPAELYSLEGRVAIVTGAAGGLGRWFAAGLSAAGARVLVTDLEQGPVDGLVSLLAEAGGEAAASRSTSPRRTPRSGSSRPPSSNSGACTCSSTTRPSTGACRSSRWTANLGLDQPDRPAPAYFLSQAAARRMIEQGGAARSCRSRR